MRKRLTQELIALRQHTPEQPYSIVHRLKLARAYRGLGYPDLAVGDAYKALLLVDEVREESEYYDEALEAAEADFLTDRMAKLDVEQDVDENVAKEDEVWNWAQTKSKNAYVSRRVS